MVNRQVRHKQGRKKKHTNYTLVTHKSVANKCICYKQMWNKQEGKKAKINVVQTSAKRITGE